MSLLNLLIALFLILLVLSFVTAIVLCRKLSFTIGFYFLLLLSLPRIVPMLYSPFTRKYIDSILEGERSLPVDMTIGELLAWFSLITHILEVIPFIYLAVVLYRLWKSKSAVKEDESISN